MEERDQYWVYQWLDRYHLTSLEQVKTSLADRTLFEDLRLGATKALEQRNVIVPAGESVIVGRGIDLSGQLDCFHPEWRKQQAHRLFSKVWHYFDRVIIDDSVTHELTLHQNEPRLVEFLLWHFEMLLYLREIGAEPLLGFRLKPAPCQVHLAQHVAEAGLSMILESADDVALSLIERAKFSFKKERGEIAYRVDCQGLEHTQWGTIRKADAQGLDESGLKFESAKQIVAKFLAYLASDVRAAKFYEVPLGAGIPFHQSLLAKSTSPSVAEVAMTIQLPILEGVPPQTLIKIRTEEHEYFEQFRVALRLAIKERLNNAGTTDAGKIAEEIEKDIIAPELTLIRTRLSAAERALTRKSAVGLMMGTLTTTCGILAGLPDPTATMAGVTAAVAMTATASSKYLDELNDISLKGMYFAWQAERYV